MSFLWHVDWLGVAGLLIAIGALVQSRKAIRQADDHMRQNQKHAELSVRPLLTGHYILLNAQLFAIDIENRGLGPAIITYWEVWPELEPKDILPIESSTYLGKFLPSKLPNPDLPFVYSLKKQGTYLPAGSDWRLFELVTTSLKDKKFIEAVRGAIENISIRIEYESLYGEKFSETVSHVKRI